MNHLKPVLHAIGALLVLVFLAGCSSPTPPAEPLFKLIRTVQITPDATFHRAGFARINYVPATDQFVVTFGTIADKQSDNCQGAGYAYKGYTLDMQETGKSGYFLSSNC